MHLSQTPTFFPENLPLNTDLEDGSTLVAHYNAAGMRVLKEFTPSEGGSSTYTWYVRDGDETLATIDETGKINVNVLGQGIEGQWVDGASPRYFIKDHLGSTRGIVDSQGHSQASYDYANASLWDYPFGLIMPGHSSNTANPNDNYKFTGHEQDQEAGLDIYHMVTRGYDPVIGRFNSIDAHYFYYPHLSSYSYVGNNPINYWDPFGMDFYLDEETGSILWANTSEDTYTKDGVTYVNAGTTVLTFDGELLTIHQQVEDEDGNRSVESSVFEANSGLPDRKTGGFDYSTDRQKMENRGPTPEGLYRLGNYGYSSTGFPGLPGYSDPKGRAFFIDINTVAHDAQGRTGLEIHPDGNVLGTAGCIGIYCQVPDLPQQFYDAILNTLSGIPLNKRPLLNVSYKDEE